MNHVEVGHYWNGNAEAWTELARSGYDIYRDFLNTPAFFEMLPAVEGLVGLDVGCGEGHNTRLLAERGARITGMDISENFIHFARQTENELPLGIHYLVASAVEIPFPDGSFDFATAFMSMMDIPETDRALAEVHRILKPGGFFQFSISHPCFDTPHRRNLRNEKGTTYAIEVGDYFRNIQGEVSEWIFSSIPYHLRGNFPRFKTPRFTRTLSQWLNLLLVTGFQLEYIAEPRPSNDVVQTCPQLQDAQVVAYFLHLRVRKPGNK